MNMKGHILTALREQFESWEELLASLSAAQLAAPLAPSPWTIKDVLAHLWAWQQRSIARIDAARLGREPVFPQWAPGVDPDADAATETVNSFLYETYRRQPWPELYQNWSGGFLHFLELGDGISERDLLDGGKYPWMQGHPLAWVLVASYDHHQEHLEKILDWLQQHGTMSSGG